MPSPVFVRLLFSSTFYKQLLYHISLKYAELVIDNVTSGCVWSPHKALWCFYFIRNAWEWLAHRNQSNFLFILVTGVRERCMVFFFRLLVFQTCIHHYFPMVPSEMMGNHFIVLFYMPHLKHRIFFFISLIYAASTPTFLPEYWGA